MTEGNELKKYDLPIVPIHRSYYQTLFHTSHIISPLLPSFSSLIRSYCWPVLFITQNLDFYTFKTTHILFCFFFFSPFFRTLISKQFLTTSVQSSVHPGRGCLSVVHANVGVTKTAKENDCWCSTSEWLMPKLPLGSRHLKLPGGILYSEIIGGLHNTQINQSIIRSTIKSSFRCIETCPRWLLSCSAVAPSLFLTSLLWNYPTHVLWD